MSFLIAQHTHTMNNLYACQKFKVRINFSTENIIKILEPFFGKKHGL